MFDISNAQKKTNLPSNTSNQFSQLTHLDAHPKSIIFQLEKVTVCTTFSSTTRTNSFSVTITNFKTNYFFSKSPTNSSKNTQKKFHYLKTSSKICKIDLLPAENQTKTNSNLKIDVYSFEVDSYKFQYKSQHSSSHCIYTTSFLTVQNTYYQTMLHPVQTRINFKLA